MQLKILTLDELSSRIEDFRKEKKRIGMCHGCFDLMHPGHIKHFQSARQLCDVLIVTITPDRFVNKGPGRPVFNERLRLESIAALECVDYVALNRWETAVETLKLLRPDVYIKGPDYRDRSRDVTGKIVDEEETIIRIGGQLVTTDDVTFSSTNLLNSYFNVFTPEAGEFLAGFRKTYSAEDIQRYLDTINRMKICVIGDSIIDEYHYVKSIGKSTKSPTISTKFEYAEAYAGGILAIANHLAGFSDTVSIISLIGTNDDQRSVISEQLNSKIDTHFFSKPDSPTIVKRRYVDIYRNTKIFEVTFLNDHPIDVQVETTIGQFLENRLSSFDLVIVADFGHGFLTPTLREVIRKHSSFLAVNSQTNSNNFGFNMITHYQRPDFISIDENELRLPFSSRFEKVHDLVHRLAKSTQCDRINITLGERGNLFFDGNTFTQAPTLSNNVVDSVGAGDAVLAITSALVKQGAPPAVVSFIGNAVGALAVQIVGNKVPINPTDLSRLVISALKY